MRSGHDTPAADLGGTYPASPGWMVPTRRRKAVRRARGHARLIAARVLAVLEEVPSGLSAHEIAHRLALPVSTVAPRLSELRHDGRIAPSGRRTRNPSGSTANIWTLWPDDLPYVDALSIALDEIGW